MKALIYLLALIPHLIFGQCDPAGNGTLSGEVQNNSVILRNDTIYRNCGALYNTEFSWLSNDSLIWMQTDIGDAAFCQCHFDLSATLDSLGPGNYTVLVYYTNRINSDTCYIGNVTFSVTNPENFAAPEFINQWQSACFTTGIEDTPDFSAGIPEIFPNPAGDKLFLNSGLYYGGKIWVYDMNGRVIYETSHRSSMSEIATGHLMPGVYLLKLIGNNNVSVYRFIKK
ncbi:MAG: T9SS type A sorting domain-containing protein [Bacteroidales bacterium]|nr:T9SS type A sorting domain-containing protein [Bacteroidales bacterium]